MKQNNVTTKSDVCDAIAKLSPVMHKALREHPAKHPTIEHSFCVLLEEVEELKAEVFKKYLDYEALTLEALHVAFTALRMVADNEHCMQSCGA